MVTFDVKALESFKYADLVKLAKEHDIYRRYAPKAELVEKLMALSEPTVESLNDVSMPSFMENDDIESDEVDQDVENNLPKQNQILSPCDVQKGKEKAQDVRSRSVSPRPPLVDKRKKMNSKTITSDLKSSMTVEMKPNTPQALRRSLAGPAKSISKGVKLQRQTTFDVDIKTDNPSPTPQSATHRLTRQRTFDVEANKHQMKREGTFDVEVNKHQMKREDTFDVELPNVQHSHSRKKGTKCVVPTQKLTREVTFEVEIKSANGPKISRPSRTCKLRREGTFEVEDSSISGDLSQVPDRTPSAPITAPTPKAKTPSNRFSHVQDSTRKTRRSPYQSRKVSIATPSSVKPPGKDATGQSVPRRFITSRAKPLKLSPSGERASATKSKIPSLMHEIQNKKAEVSAKKITDATGAKPAVGKKVPDFGAIHKRLFGKMESIVDSRQKVIDKVNSMQKTRPMCDSRSPANKKVVRKLLSPKAGKSKCASPKPLHHVASAYASNIVQIQKRPSMSGVSKLKSPRFTYDVKSKGGATNQFGFSKVAPSRKEALKASVMERKPMKRNSPMSKAKQVLQTVRLNKRFELQMKHRLAQQGL